MGSKNLGWYQRALAAQEQEAAAEARPPFPAAPLHGRERRRAFLDVELGGKELGRLEVELAVSRFRQTSLPDCGFGLGAVMG